jgi:hypothetical protein
MQCLARAHDFEERAILFGDGAAISAFVVYELVRALPDEFISGPAEHPLSRRVDEDDLTRSVRRVKPFRRVVDDRADEI